MATEGSSMSPLTIRRRSSVSPTRHTCDGRQAGGQAGKQAGTTKLVTLVQ